MPQRKKNSVISKWINDPSIFLLSTLALIALILDYGYRKSYFMHLGTDIFYEVFSIAFFLFFLIQFPGFKKWKSKPVGYYAAFFVSSVLLVLSLINTVKFLSAEDTSLNFYTASLVMILTLFELSGRLYMLKNQTLHPALVFALSFGVLICIGTLILIAPNSTTNGISFLDALFTSTSAVCVTGLAVLDTGQGFTTIGQLTILGLIQFGALGMLSFTSLFALFFKGFGSYESRLNLKNMINAESLEGTFKTLIQIIIFVLLIEGVGALFIFQSLEETFGSFNEKLFFSVFHSVSAFCNAGFSTLSNSLFEESFRYNYSLHMIIAVLIIFGGLGYGIAITLYDYARRTLSYWQYRLFKFTFRKEIQRLKPQIGLNARLVLNTTWILLVIGLILFFALEYDNTLQNHSLGGKVITAFFQSVTTRTAGFNTIDTGSIGLPAIMITILLMWIGASPGSTGGGIKTTTFSVAIFNIVHQIFGSKNIRIGYRRIPQKALQRASAIITISILTIGAAIFFLLFSDAELGVMPIIFEAFSAFSTVGLSMGITADLSDFGKSIIIITMFIGRVGLLTLLTGMIRQLYVHKQTLIEYPEEEIFIN